MDDLLIMRDRTGEWMLAKLSGGTEAGEAFVDAWTSPEMVVIDAGIVVVREQDLPSVRLEAEKAGLTVDEYMGEKP